MIFSLCVAKVCALFEVHVVFKIGKCSENSKDAILSESLTLDA